MKIGDTYQVVIAGTQITMQVLDVITNPDGSKIIISGQV